MQHLARIALHGRLTRPITVAHSTATVAANTRPRLPVPAANPGHPARRELQLHVQRALQPCRGHVLVRSLMPQPVVLSLAYPVHP
jgi:hypothetical protein